MTKLLTLALFTGLITASVDINWLNPEQRPLTALLVFSAVLAIPLLRREDLQTHAGSVQQTWSSWPMQISAVLLVWGWAGCVMHFVATSRYVGGVDFFFYLCNARDMLQYDDFSRSAYGYFPGVYQFWRTVMVIGGTGLPWLQFSFIAVLWCNALLVGVVVWRATRSWLAAGYAGIWYLVLTTRFEGLQGTSEPIATIPVLAALAAWNGETLRGKRGAARVVALGIGLGLALLAKQQAGVLSLGAIVLLAHVRRGADDRRHSIALLCALPLVAVLVFVTGVIWEGHGLEPVEKGLRQAGAYAVHGGWVSNVWHQIRNDESAAVGALIGVTLWIISIVRLQRQADAELPAHWNLTGFVLIAGAATLMQFTHRAYRHYFLLTLPCLVIGVVIPVTMGVRHWLRDRYNSDRLRAAILFLAVVPLFHTGGPTSNLHVWRRSKIGDYADLCRWEQQPQIAAEIGSLRNAVTRRESVCVLPPIRNSLHFELQTRSMARFGYAFGQSADLSRVDWSVFDAVITVDRRTQAGDANWVDRNCDAARSTAVAVGFRPTLETDSFRVYRRDETRN